MGNLKPSMRRERSSLKRAVLSLISLRGEIKVERMI